MDEPGLALECKNSRLGVSAADVEALRHLGSRSVLLLDSFGLVHYTYAMMHNEYDIHDMIVKCNMKLKCVYYI